MFLPRTLAWIVIIAGGGYFLISQFGESQVAAFSLENPNWEPVELMIKQRLAGRYSAIAWGWVFSTIAFFWTFIGKRLNIAERMMG